MNNDFQNSILKLVDLTLQCRPSDPWEFASIFFVDEQSVDHKLAHALHCLPFLMDHDPIKFRECASVIFCTEFDDNFAVSGPPSHIGEIGIESVQRILRSLLSHRMDLVGSLNSYLPKSEYVGFVEFENILKLSISCSQFCARLQLVMETYSQKHPDGGLETYIHFLKAQKPTPDGILSERELVLSIEGAESYRNEHPQPTSLWPKAYANSTIQLLARELTDSVTDSLR